MDLLERYLQAVGQHLAAGTREDVLAELRVNLLAEMDARAEEMERPLTESEEAAILKAHGRPMLVAARYLPQHYLIGPAVFPFYLLTLRKGVPFVVLLYFLARVGTFLFSPSPGAFAANSCHRSRIRKSRSRWPAELQTSWCTVFGCCMCLRFRTTSIWF
jgi:hypothetical protein